MGSARNCSSLRVKRSSGSSKRRTSSRLGGSLVRSISALAGPLPLHRAVHARRHGSGDRRVRARAAETWILAQVTCAQPWALPFATTAVRASSSTRPASSMARALTEELCQRDRCVQVDQRSTTISVRAKLGEDHLRRCNRLGSGNASRQGRRCNEAAAHQLRELSIRDRFSTPDARRRELGNDAHFFQIAS
jgi:hypothetical protein